MTSLNFDVTVDTKCTCTRCCSYKTTEVSPPHPTLCDCTQWWPRCSFDMRCARQLTANRFSIRLIGNRLANRQCDNAFNVYRFSKFAFLNNLAVSFQMSESQIREAKLAENKENNLDKLHSELRWLTIDTEEGIGIGKWCYYYLLHFNL